MPYTMPSRDAVGPNRTLTNISVAYMQEAGIFVARRLFPVVPVENMSAQYIEFNRADWNRLEMGQRTPGTESPGGGYRLSRTPYLTDVNAVHKTWMIRSGRTTSRSPTPRRAPRTT